MLQFVLSTYKHLVQENGEKGVGIQGVD